MATKQNRVETTKEKVTVYLNMSLEQARQIQWPSMDNLQGTFGDLYDQGKLGTKQLGWAIENGYKAEVRSAATTFMAHRLGKATEQRVPLRYGPEIVDGNRYLEEREWDSTFEALKYAILGMFIAYMIVFWMINRVIAQFERGAPWDLTIVAGSIVLVAILVLATPAAWFLKRKFDKEIDNLKSYRAGREGEAWLEGLIRGRLDSRWVVFRNIVLPGVISDIDFVCVSNSGVWVIEAKSYQSKIKALNDIWERRDRRGWKPILPSPTVQARTNAARLRGFLKDHNVTVWVRPAVVLTKAQDKSNIIQTLEDPKYVQVWMNDETEEQLYELNAQDATILEHEREKIVFALRAIAKQSKEKDESTQSRPKK